jgi:hypothetical protein
MATQEYGSKVVDANTVKVSAQLYRVVKSFLNSSLKTIYLWNTGVHQYRRFGEWSWEDVVTFRKAGKWTLKYIDKVEQNPPSEAKSENYVVLETPNLRSHIKFDGVRVEVVDPVVAFTIDAHKNPVELERTLLVPDRDLPFAEPLSLAEVVEKMALYFETAQRHIEECARKGEAEASAEAAVEASAQSAREPAVSG